MAQWQAINEKFLLITIREKILILSTGLAIIIFMFFTLVIDDNMIDIKHQQGQIKLLSPSIKGLQSSIDGLKQALTSDPNTVLKKQLAEHEGQLLAIDQSLLELTSDLIDPVQMRYALTELLALEQGVKLLSFEVIEAKPIISAPETDIGTGITKEALLLLKDDGQTPVALYQHGIKLKLQGEYFPLRNYLRQLETLSWRFFWQQFDYHLLTYPKSELEIEIYSLSTKRAFIGV